MIDELSLALILVLSLTLIADESEVLPFKIVLTLHAFKFRYENELVFTTSIAGPAIPVRL